MKFDIITIFPDIVQALVEESVLKKGIEKGLIEVVIHDLRKWTADERKTVDDRPFGGGPGMLLKLEPIYSALKEIGVYPERPATTKVALTSAGGQTWNQDLAQQYSESVDRLVIICGRYEGVDQRVVDNLIDVELSIGNYVLTGGELAAGVIIDSTSRLIQGVLGNEESLLQESHTGMAKEYPHYTRPAEFTTESGQVWKVPDILLSGNHADIEKWRQSQAKK
jgi:tRNA (guanine37-N1)-methyltransferase